MTQELQNRAKCITKHEMEKEAELGLGFVETLCATEFLFYEVKIVLKLKKNI